MSTRAYFTSINAAAALVGLALITAGCDQKPVTTPPGETAKTDQQANGADKPDASQTQSSDEPTLADAFESFRSGAEEAAVKSLQALGYYDPNCDGELDVLQTTQEEFARLTEQARETFNERAAEIRAQSRALADDLMTRAQQVAEQSPEKAREYLQAARNLGEYLQRQSLETLEQTGATIATQARERLEQLDAEPSDAATDGAPQPEESDAENASNGDASP